MSIKLGARYYYRVGNYISCTQFEIISHDGCLWIGRSYDSFETKWYFNDNGQQVGTEESGIFGECNDVWLVQ